MVPKTALSKWFRGLLIFLVGAIAATLVGVTLSKWIPSGRDDVEHVYDAVAGAFITTIWAFLCAAIVAITPSWRRGALIVAGLVIVFGLFSLAVKSPPEIGEGVGMVAAAATAVAAGYAIRKWL